MKRLERIIKNVSDCKKYLIRTGITSSLVIGSIFSGSAKADRELHYSIQESQKPANHAGYVQEACAEILLRTANPFPKNPEDDFRHLQEDFLNLSDPRQKEFLDEARKETSQDNAFAVHTEDGVRTGYVFHLSRGIKSIRFRESAIGEPYRYHTIPTARDKAALSKFSGKEQITAVRRHPGSHFISGCFFNNAVPLTYRDLILDPTNQKLDDIADLATDMIYGARGNGKPVLSSIEYSMPALIDRLFLSQPEGEYIIWAGPYWTSFTLERDQGQEEGILKEAKEVSILAKDERTGILYNPHHLTRDDVAQVKRGLPTSADLDILIVDRTRTNEEHFRTLVLKGQNIGIISSRYWELLIHDDKTYRVEPTDAEIDLEMLDILGDASTVTLPSGTRVVTRGEYTGIKIKSPERMPVAFYRGDVQWISSDSDELMELVSNNYCVPIGSRSFTRTLNGAGYSMKIPIEKRDGLPEPIIMFAPNDQIIDMIFGVNWEDPWIAALDELDRRDAYAMTYDATTKTFKYHMDSVPLTQKVQAKRPLYQKQPSLDER